MNPISSQSAQKVLQAAYDVSLLLGDCANLADARREVLRIIGETTDWKAGMFWEVGKDELYCAEVWSAVEANALEFVKASQEARPRRDVGLPGRVWSSGKPAWADFETQKEMEQEALATKAGFRIAFAFPVRFAQQVLGVIEFFGEERHLDDELVQMMVSLGQQVGQFIERCRMSDALQQQKNELSSFVENASVGMHWIGADGIIQWANDAELQMLGYSKDEYVGRPISEFLVKPEAEDSVLACLRRGEKVRNREGQMKCRDGSLKTVLIDSSAFTHQGKFIHSQCMVRDVTERRQADEVRAHFAAIIESSADAIISTDLNGVIRSWNGSAERMLGYPADEAIGKSIKMLIPKDRAGEEERFVDRLRCGDRVEHYETVRRRKDGQSVDISLTVSPIRDTSGQIIGASKIARDITERKQAEIALKQSEANFRRLADSMPQIIWTASPEGAADYYNRRWYELTGSKEGQTGNEMFFEALHPEDRKRTLSRWMESVKTGEPYEIEHRLNMPSAGGYRWHLARALPVRGAEGKIIRWFGTCTDIHEQKRVGERVIRLNETLVTVLEAIPDIVFVIGLDGGIEFRNAAASRFMEAVQHTWLPVAIGSELERVLKTGQHYLPTDLKAVHRFVINNQERFFLSRIVRMMTPEVEVFGAVVMLQDVTEFRLLDEVKTNLIATVSHELKTPITSVRTALMVLLEQTFGPLNTRQAELVTMARDEGERLLRTLDSLLDLTRFEETSLESRLEDVAPEALVKESIAEVQSTAAQANLTLKAATGEDLPRVKVDRERVLHVLTNFLTNAIKFSPSGGEVVVQALRTETGVRFSVKDEGPGVAEQYQSRIFEKFFRVPDTHKPGAGLGLWIARQFIHAHGGRIGLVSEPGRGSEFYFILPHHGERTNR
jgi:PAS domain S-box-containing protein